MTTSAIGDFGKFASSSSDVYNDGYGSMGGGMGLELGQIFYLNGLVLSDQTKLGIDVTYGNFAWTKQKGSSMFDVATFFRIRTSRKVYRNKLYIILYQYII